MESFSGQGDGGTVGFTDSLDALSHPVRVRILQQLRSPKILKDIKVHVSDRGEGGPLRERVLTRQAVKGHLEKLLQTGVVLAREAKYGHTSTVEYVLNQSALFCLAEEFRELAGLRPVEPVEEQTILRSELTTGKKVKGPCLLIVKGLDEGRVFPLQPPSSKTGEWVIGRRRGLDVSLDYDPFVSSENTVVRLQDGEWTVEDLLGSRNGTTLNLHRIPKARQVPLNHQDLVGVGRSVLAFQANFERV